MFRRRKLIETCQCRLTSAFFGLGSFLRSGQIGEWGGHWLKKTQKNHAPRGEAVSHVLTAVHTHPQWLTRNGIPIVFLETFFLETILCSFTNRPGSFFYFCLPSRTTEKRQLIFVYTSVHRHYVRRPTWLSWNGVAVTCSLTAYIMFSRNARDIFSLLLPIRIMSQGIER